MAPRRRADSRLVTPSKPTNNGGDWAAFPAVDPNAQAAAGPVLFNLEIDEPLFAVRLAPGGGWHYDWLNGPNEGYGFASSGPPHRTRDEHRQQVRTFLSMVDPATGYIADN